MFRRFFISLARIFRLPGCRGSGSARVARQATSELPSSNASRLVSSQLDPINATPGVSTEQPIPPSPILLSSVITPPPDTLTPILIIGRDPDPSSPPPPTAPAPPRDVGSQAEDADTESLQDSPSLSTQPNPNAARRVSFQLPPSTPEERPATPLSTCSTLVPDAKSTGEAGTEMSQVAPPERPPRPETPDLDCVPPLPTEYGIGMDSILRSRSGRTTPVSLYSPRPARARVNASRFSLPATPTTPMMAPNTRSRNDRRESKRASFMSLVPGARSTKREKRSSRWSRELTMSEAEDLLRLLREL